MTFNRPSAIAIFLANVNPLIPFFYYLHMLSGRLKGKSILFLLFIQRFLLVLISDTVNYGVNLSRSYCIIMPAMPF
jgi:hypothetical protein